MSTLSSLPTRLGHQSFDHSLNVQDLIKQNQQLKTNTFMMLQQIQQMNKILQAIYSQKTTSDNQPNINQQEIQALAHQVVQLQKQLQQQKKKNEQNNANNQQTLQVITEITKQYQAMEIKYQNKIESLENQIDKQKQEFKFIIDSTESKFQKNIQDYHSLAEKIKKKDQRINQLEKLYREIHQPSSKKDLKISTTIEDLKMTMQKQIEEKDTIIRKYENLCKDLKALLKC